MAKAAKSGGRGAKPAATRAPGRTASSAQAVSKRVAKAAGAKAAGTKPAGSRARASTTRAAPSRTPPAAATRADAKPVAKPAAKVAPKSASKPATKTATAPRAASRRRPATPAQQFATFIARFHPDMQKLVHACRAVLRQRLPSATELVYQDGKALAIGFCASADPDDCIVSLAIYANTVSLSFYHGASLPDPRRLLQGGGNQHRYIPLQRVQDLVAPAVSNLIRAAIAHAKSRLGMGAAARAAPPVPSTKPGRR